MNASLAAAVTWLGGFQQDGDPGGGWPPEAIGIAVGGLVVLAAAVIGVILTGRRPPRSDERSPDG